MNGLRTCLIGSLLIFTLLLNNVNVFSYGEIKHGEETVSFLIPGNFDYIVSGFEYYNYKVISARIDHSNIAFRTETRFAEVKDIELKGLRVPREMQTYLKINSITRVNNHFNYNVFDTKDTYLERVYKIFKWINDNIKYTMIPDNKQQSIEYVFDKRIGDCYGFSKLFNYLLRLSGIPSKTVFCYYKEKDKEKIPEYFHSVVTFYHPQHGWILMEPQGMFLSITPHHIVLFEEDDLPPETIKYFQVGDFMKFTNKQDEINYKKSEFLDRFVSGVKGLKERIIREEVLTSYIVTGTKFKFISAPNDLLKRSYLKPIEFPQSDNVEGYILLDKDNNLFKFSIDMKDQVINFSSGSGQSFLALKQGGKDMIFNIAEGLYNLMYMRKGLPYKLFNMTVYNRDNSLFEQLEPRYFYKQGNFKKVTLDFPDNTYIDIERKQTGFIFIEELLYDPNIPIYIDYNDRYFYFFGYKDIEFTFKFDQ